MANPQDMPRHIPYHCPACLRLPQRFVGILVIEGRKIPSCTDHDKPVKLVPSRGV